MGGGHGPTNMWFTNKHKMGKGENFRARNQLNKSYKFQPRYNSQSVEHKDSSINKYGFTNRMFKTQKCEKFGSQSTIRQASVLTTSTLTCKNIVKKCDDNNYINQILPRVRCAKPLIFLSLQVLPPSKSWLRHWWAPTEKKNREPP